VEKKVKSAYELAMERLEKASGPSKKLTDAQRAEIADIDSVYDARVAETKLEYDGKMGSAQSPADMETLRAELAARLSELDKEREEKKEAIWNRA
jgi:uncharacterized protein YecT (DUF1311 family)